MEVLKPQHYTASVEHSSGLWEHVAVNVHHQVAAACILHHKTHVFLSHTEHILVSVLDQLLTTCTLSQNTSVPVIYRTYPCQCASLVTDNMCTPSQNTCTCHTQNTSLSVCIWQQTYSITKYTMFSSHTHTHTQNANMINVWHQAPTTQCSVTKHAFLTCVPAKCNTHHCNCVPLGTDNMHTAPQNTNVPVTQRTSVHH